MHYLEIILRGLQLMTKQEAKRYIKNSLEELPQLLRNHALGRLNKQGKTDLINLLITENIEKDKVIKQLETDIKLTEELTKDKDRY